MAKKKARKKPESLETFFGFVDEFKGESDRAAVVLGAAKLDILLFQLIEHFLRPCTSSKDELLDGNGGIATFSARIHAAHRLGLIDDGFARALHLIRKICNSFAHESSAVSLNTGAHADRIRELVLPFRSFSGFSQLYSQFDIDEQSTAGDFKTVLVLLCGRLLTAVDKVEPIGLNNVKVVIPDIWQEEDPIAIEE